MFADRRVHVHLLGHRMPDDLADESVGQVASLLGVHGPLDLPNQIESLTVVSGQDVDDVRVVERVSHWVFLHLWSAACLQAFADPNTPSNWPQAQLGSIHSQARARLAGLDVLASAIRSRGDPGPAHSEAASTWHWDY